MGWAATLRQERTYQRHEPEKTLLYQVIQENWNTFQNLAEKNREGAGLPTHVVREFESYLGCGILANGFVRVKCGDCKHEKLVAFSCKRRGFCPSCCSRRMNESAAHLVDRVLPQVPVRQYVLSVPMPLRFWMASNSGLTTQILAIMVRGIGGYLKKKARAAGHKGRVETGCVTLIQRYGGALNLNIHFHTLFLEGVYVIPLPGNNGEKAVFHELPPPTDQEVSEVLATLQRRIVRALVKRGLLSKEEENLDESDFFSGIDPVVAAAQGASVHNQIAFGENQGQKVRKIGSFGQGAFEPEPAGPKYSNLGGFSLHANTAVHAQERGRLKKLCRYIARPPLSTERLFAMDDGRIGYWLKQAWRDGTKAVSFTPLELIEKLVALVPQPRAHLTRFHGVFAPNFKFRAQVVPNQSADKAMAGETAGERKPSPKEYRLTWAEMLKRVFRLDVSTCPDCGGKLKVIASIMERNVIKEILSHLGFDTEPPGICPARPSPQAEFAFG